MKPNPLPPDQEAPASLDDIIRTNRDSTRLYLSKATEIAVLQGPIPDRPAKGIITDWCFITLLVSQTGEAFVYLIGSHQTDHSSCMTSKVTLISDKAAMTKSGSIYSLAGNPTTTPDLPYICATLNLWGIGPRFGVPPYLF